MGHVRAQLRKPSRVEGTAMDICSQMLLAISGRLSVNFSQLATFYMLPAGPPVASEKLWVQNGKCSENMQNKPNKNIDGILLLMINNRE